MSFCSEAMKAQALRTAQDAYASQISRVNNFMDTAKVGGTANANTREHNQPSIFEGQLKSYQLKGMNWLANLYYFVSDRKMNFKLDCFHINQEIGSQILFLSLFCIAN